MTARRTITEAFVPHRRSLLESPAWRVLSLEAHRLLDRIEIEHLRHGGKENGCLVIPYADLEQYVIGHRRSITRAIRDTEALGLLRLIRGRGGNGEFRAPSQYRLTYLPTAEAGPSDEWRDIKDIDDAKARLKAVKKRRTPSAWFRAKTRKIMPFPVA